MKHWGKHRLKLKLRYTEAETLLKKTEAVADTSVSDTAESGCVWNNVANTVCIWNTEVNIGSVWNIDENRDFGKTRPKRKFHPMDHFLEVLMRWGH